MALNFLNLDARTRHYMIEEIHGDVERGTLYVSARLSQVGQTDYVRLLSEAAGAYDDAWLAAELNSNGRLNATETRNKPSGGVTVAKVPYNAAEMLAEGELNRFYIRALCRIAIESGNPEIIVYRAKQVAAPRPESEAMIGASLDANAVLADLRSRPGVDTALGLPPGPNSGLSARLP